MASTDAKPVPQKNVAYRVTFPILDADGDLVTGASSPDSEISKDGGTFTDCTNEATEIATSSGVYFLDLTSTEMNADTVAIIVKSGTGKTTALVMYPEEAGDIRVNVTQFGGSNGTFASGRPEVNASHIAGSSVSTSSAQIGVNVVNAGGTAWGSGAITANAIASDAITAAKIADGAIDAGAFAADAITAAKLAADVTTELQSGLATASALTTVSGKIDTIDDFLDTEVAAIKTVTDKVDTALESDGGVYRFTENALEQAPAGGGGGGPTASEIADAVWEEAITDHSGTSGSTAEQLAAAGAAGDPWATALPGAYGSGTAGKIVGDNLNATVSSRASQSSLDTVDGIVDAILVDTAEIGAAGAGLTALPWNAAWDAEVQSEATDALNAYDPPTRAELTSDKNEILTAVGDVPTNAELSTALAAADDAVLAAIAALNNLSSAQVEAIISTTARSEPSAVPAANANLAAKINWMFMLMRNKIEQTASAQTLYADNESTPVAEAAVSDDGTTATRGEFAAP